jgi:hypothetical protein
MNRTLKKRCIGQEISMIFKRLRELRIQMLLVKTYKDKIS